MVGTMENSDVIYRTVCTITFHVDYVP